jgi:hypothetical protein
MHPNTPSMPASPDSTARLNPATRVLWRGVDSVQLELGRRAVVLDGVDSATVRRLVDDPDADPAGTGATARRPSDPRLDAALGALRRRGFVWADTEEPLPHDAGLAPRLGPELAALRVRYGHRARGVLVARTQARVAIRGTGRTAPLLAAILAAAGVGHVHVAGPGKVSLRSLVPGGPVAGDEGRDYEPACAESIARTAPGVRTSAPTSLESLDLVILAVDGPLDEDVRAVLHQDAQAHLVVQSSADHVSIGPLVLPGLTSCLHCADLHRLDRDPAWSALAVQLSTASRYPPPSDIALVSLAAGVAAVHVLAFLDGDEPANWSCPTGSCGAGPGHRDRIAGVRPIDRGRPQVVRRDLGRPLTPSRRADVGPLLQNEKCG